MIRLFSAAAKVKSWIALKTWNVFATWILILNLIAVSLKEYIISISLQEFCLYLVLEVFYSVVSRMLSLVDSNNIRKYLHLHILIEPFIYGFNLSTKHSNIRWLRIMHARYNFRYYPNCVNIWFLSSGIVFYILDFSSCIQCASQSNVE